MPIIIVDDVQNLVNAYRKFFALAGLNVLATFNGGEELLNFFEDSSVAPEIKALANRALVMIDHRMPGLNGLETASKLKKTYPNLKTVITVDEWTLSDSHENKVFDAVLYKPFSIGDLLRIIDCFSSPIMDFEGSKIFEDPVEIGQLFHNVISENSQKICVCCEKSNAFRILFSSLINSFLREAIAKGFKIFFLTEITPLNLQFCKQFSGEPGIQFHHMPGIQSNFIIVDERHFVSMNALSRDDITKELILFSNLETVAKQNQYLFDFMWNSSVSGQQKIRELENSVGNKKTLDIYIDLTEAMAKRITLVNNAKYCVNACYEASFAPLVNRSGLKESYLAAIERGVHVRHITEIDPDNIDACRELMEIGIELRHIPHIVGGFAFNEEELIARATYADPLAEAQSIYSNYPLLVYEHQSIFNLLWNSAEPAENVTTSMSGERKREKSIQTDNS